jgi:hypothetical protein
MTERKFTNEELATCAKREVGQRKWVYPRWIANGKLTQTKADREIAMMEEIARVFEALGRRDNPDLFGGDQAKENPPAPERRGV